MNNREEFSKWLEDELYHRRWTQAELVRKTGLSRGGVSLLVNAMTRPNPETCIMIARAFNIPPDIPLKRAGYLEGRKDSASPTIDEANFKLELLPEKYQKLVVEYIEFLLHKRNGDDKRTGLDEPDEIPEETNNGVD